MMPAAGEGRVGEAARPRGEKEEGCLVTHRRKLEAAV